MLIAVTRAVSPRFAECELTHLTRQPIDYELARAQHSGYEDALRSLGLEIQRLPDEPDFPDSVFVEDTAIVLDEIAIITRPGAESRRGETSTAKAILSKYRPVVELSDPATLDGGDVLVLGRDVYVGLSSRSTGAAIEQVRHNLEPLGYRVHPVPLKDCLHLKSGVTQAGDDLLLINSEWISREHFPDWRFIEVDPGEPDAANILLLPNGAVYPAQYARTRARLQGAGVPVTAVDATEVAKAEGGVTCCSIVFKFGLG